MALVKCAECKKEISDTVKKCPHCGYKMKQNLDLKDFIKKRKLFIIISIILIILIIIISKLVFTVNYRFKKYLTSNGFTCSNDTYTIREQSITGMYCKKGNYVYLFEDSYPFILLYQDDKANSIVLSTETYYDQTIIPFYSDDEEKCAFFGEDEELKVGSKIVLSHTFGETTDRYCNEKIELVSDVVREYEKTLENAGIEIYIPPQYN